MPYSDFTSFLNGLVLTIDTFAVGAGAKVLDARSQSGCQGVFQELMLPKTFISKLTLPNVLKIPL